MRPRHHCRGEQPGSQANALRDLGFNAATASLPWRTSDEKVVFEAIVGLQCGHGITAVENMGLFGLILARAMGFNAATASLPWRTTGGADARQSVPGLQCGHGIT